MAEKSPGEVLRAGTEVPSPRPWAVCEVAFNEQWYPGHTIYSVEEGKRIGDLTEFDFRSPANAALIVRAVNAHAELIEALKRADELCTKALPKFNWGKSALTAEAITLLNEVPGKIRRAIALAERGA